jgi:hypothetical protein
MDSIQLSLLHFTPLHSYEDVFSKTAFDTLPEHRKWDHTIELECKPLPGFRKVYLMTLTKQTKMDAFFEEALATGQIQQSKSPLGAPVFFIKKTDGKLHFVQEHSTPLCKKINILSPSSTI